MLVGRVWSKTAGGPCPVLISEGEVFDLTPLAATISALLEIDGLVDALRDPSRFASLGSLDAFLRGEAGDLLAPADLQAVKAAGVTFADSMLERVIEEQAKGDPLRAQEIRGRLAPVLGDNLKGLVAGSDKAAEVKKLLQELGLWSQYLEVGIGPDAEIFTKAQPMSSVGCGAYIGIHPKSDWNNPEPEVVLAVTSKGKIVGATLGNDVNLRDFEGRSALLLSKAKDNNASCSIGPFIRLFDGAFTHRGREAGGSLARRRRQRRFQDDRHQPDVGDQPQPGRPRLAASQRQPPSIRMAWSSSSARCLRQSRTVGAPGSASRMKLETGSRSRRRASDAS